MERGLARCQTLTLDAVNIQRRALGTFQDGARHGLFSLNRDYGITLTGHLRSISNPWQAHSHTRWKKLGKFC